MTPAIRVLQLVPTRHTFQEWERQRMLDIFAELAALRADLARLLRQSTQMGRCDSCRRLDTITIQDSGFWTCRRCAEGVRQKEVAI